MKRLLTLLSLLAAPAIAQPTFTTLVTPPNNSAVSSRSMTYSGALPSAGANQTWDYSALSFTNTPTTNVSHTNLSDTPRGSSFPTATYYEVAADGAEIFYKVTGTTSSILGNYSASQGTTIVNTDAENSLTVPFSYGETQNDTYGGTYVANSINVTKTGSNQLDYSGYGTLITSDGSYDNIPMLTSVADETHNFEVSPGVFFPTRFVSTTYSWGYPGEHSFILAFIKIETYSFGSLVGTSISALKIEQTPTGLFNAAEVTSAVIYPQPAKDKIKISTEKLQGQCIATVYNMNGDAVKSTETTAIDNSITMDVQSLNKGVYMVELNNEGQLFRSKLMVQ
jgi:hypothetical protein